MQRQFIEPQMTEILDTMVHSTDLAPCENKSIPASVRDPLSGIMQHFDFYDPEEEKENTRLEDEAEIDTLLEKV